MGAPLTIWMGRSGSGKSTRLYDRLCTHAQKGERATLVVAEQYTYEADGRYATKEITENGKTYQLWYRYDEAGRLQSIYEKANGDRMRVSYTYDVGGRMVDENWFSDAENVLRILRTYYQDGTLCQAEYKSPIRNNWTWEECIYNQKGQPVMHRVIDRAKEISRQEYLFDENGNLSQEIFYENGVEVSRVQYTYTQVELNLADMEQAVARNDALWAEEAAEPSLAVFKLQKQVM